VWSEDIGGGSLPVGGAAVALSIRDTNCTGKWFNYNHECPVDRNASGRITAYNCKPWPNWAKSELALPPSTEAAAALQKEIKRGFKWNI
jgi:hypothetical protein